jgi:CRP-like cAMP-binding protein
MTPHAPQANVLFDLIDPLRRLGAELKDTSAGQTLVRAGGDEASAYFPVTAALSLVSSMRNGDSCEISMVGREGMVGLSAVFDAFDVSTACVVQVGGTCWSVPARSLRAARQEGGVAAAAMDRYFTAHLIQVSRLAACNRLHHIGRRLARWLLMLSDRIEREQLHLSQQAIANSLGVHRPTIALELQKLQHTGAIRYRSRIITILDRARLAGAACECYEGLHRAYRQMFQPLADPLAIAAGREAIAARGADTLTAVSHQLCSYLQAVLGWCALAQLPDAPSEALAAIERNARAQLPLIQGLIISDGRTA